MNSDEIKSMQEKAEFGRKAEIALEFLKDFCEEERKKIINELEYPKARYDADLVREKVQMLRTIKNFLNISLTLSDLGKISQQKLNEKNTTNFS